jgi:NlpC/P60 family putative phage cell wall peptidase
MTEATSVIVTQARTWLGTPFHHQGRLKGKGCDCLGLIVGVAEELNLKSKEGVCFSSYDQINYSKEPDCQKLISILNRVLLEVPPTEAEQGDIGLFLCSNNPQHLAIFSNGNHGLSIIHSEARARKVVEHRLDEEWHNRLIKVFRWQV